MKVPLFDDIQFFRRRPSIFSHPAEPVLKITCREATFSLLVLSELHSLMSRAPLLGPPHFKSFILLILIVLLI